MRSRGSTGSHSGLGWRHGLLISPSVRAARVVDQRTMVSSGYCRPPPAFGRRAAQLAVEPASHGLTADFDAEQPQAERQGLGRIAGLVQAQQFLPVWCKFHGRVVARMAHPFHRLGQRG